ncbi:dTDP-4-dehydrorhamnose reductase [Neptunicella marina]|uniref:dTDP-4-dehydrorhamnose reductase n=1 Tax=Neptunicella marina TaxID=2125989 RepID=UPI0030CA1C0E
MIVVIGKSGQLAQAIRVNADPQSMVFMGRDDIDIVDFDKMSLSLDTHKITAVINASAYTAVDNAESDETSAFLLNEKAVKNLAVYCKNKSLRFIHVSTDYVFGGSKGSPYLPTDDYAPQSIYGASKMAGEVAVKDILGELGCIIRTSWVYSEFGNNFVKTMLRLMKEKPQLGVIDDQIGSPTSAIALAQACLTAVEKNISGVHHFTDAGVASWYDFAVSIQRCALDNGLLEHPIPIKAIPTSAYPTPAKRPSYSVLDKHSMIDAFGIEPRHWQAELESVLSKLK